MFKILILQRYYNLSDDQTEYQILDRLSFMRFLNINMADDVPDSKTIWLFRETITEAGIIENLFERFKSVLEDKGLIGHEGKIIDASFVEVPRQRNSREENKVLKEGGLPEGWDDNQNKLEQKDMDAKWTKKNGVNYFGYKNHVKSDNKSKLIEKYKVTDASVHDSQVVEELLEQTDENNELYADSAYSGEPIEEILEDHKVENKVHEKGARNKPLTDLQKKNNKEKSRIRARVEHIFGFVENSMNGSYIQSVGIVRAAGIIGLMNLTYNMFRYTQLCAIEEISMPN
jgi:IS5 family transposase